MIKKYNKLVRDKIPQIIKKTELKPVTHIADDKEYYQKLVEKLAEEIEEFAQSGEVKELADLIEVVKAICDFKKLSWQKLERLRLKRKKTRGGFGKRIILEETK